MIMNFNLTNPTYFLTSGEGQPSSSLPDHAVTSSNQSGAPVVDDTSPEEDDVGIKVLKGIFLSLCILIAIGGNLLVCTAVFTERRLKRVKNNYFIVSLAVADLLVACVVMTFAMPNEIQNEWMFGAVFCHIWISFDIMCSTASILNLCVISFDRYKHIHNAMYYDTWMTTRKALVLIISVWILSALISFLPIHLGWHKSSSSPPPTALYNNHTSSFNTTTSSFRNTTPFRRASTEDTMHILDSDDQCIMELNFVYALVSSTISFYVPCLVMLVIYFKLFLFARSHAVSIRSMKRPALSAGRQPVSNGSSRSSIRASDHKAAFTLGVITGVFLVCWLPFFIINPISAYDPSLIPPKVFVIVTWAGYANSCLNPIIYSIFNTEFREAFKRILCLRTCGRGGGGSGAYLPPPSKSSASRNKFRKSEYEAHSSDNGSILRKTSRDHLFNDKITRL
ncbi:5-hydroxytryptamine receptor 2-like [Aplysia californica]|uniref:5-hydroxytryptamine receptor 2-like n=1 Tax=Aplysia californica TaxID=6500 RepID=A0ABM0JSC1_APLCA|nr:5-hydroxytryptamine receptor 2-like [Aplysia californica]XP_005100403.1 5-hydroxytryptamine receptor 2-like [Aplysia californica]